MWETFVTWLGTTFLKALLDWVQRGITQLINAYANRKEDENTNRENREQQEQAETDEERQRAADELAGRLGRR